MRSPSAAAVLRRAFNAAARNARMHCRTHACTASRCSYGSAWGCPRMHTRRTSMACKHIRCPGLLACTAGRPTPARSVAACAAPLDEARADKDKSGTLEGPFLAAFQPLTRDLVRTKANLQLIDLPGERAENLAEFIVAGRWEGSLNIIGTARPLQDAPDVRVGVEFQAFELRLGSARWTVPLSWVKPKGWIQTTYLDEDLRIGRGDKGSIFVASRVKGGRWRA